MKVQYNQREDVDRTGWTEGLPSSVAGSLPLLPCLLPCLAAPLSLSTLILLALRAAAIHHLRCYQEPGTLYFGLLAAQKQTTFLSYFWPAEYHAVGRIRNGQTARGAMRRSLQEPPLERS